MYDVNSNSLFFFSTGIRVAGYTLQLSAQHEARGFTMYVYRNSNAWRQSKYHIPFCPLSIVYILYTLSSSHTSQRQYIATHHLHHTIRQCSLSLSLLCKFSLLSATTSNMHTWSNFMCNPLLSYSVSRHTGEDKIKDR